MQGAILVTPFKVTGKTRNIAIASLKAGHLDQPNARLLLGAPCRNAMLLLSDGSLQQNCRRGLRGGKPTRTIYLPEDRELFKR